jgi:hypothetical protein
MAKRKEKKVTPDEIWDLVEIKKFINEDLNKSIEDLNSSSRSAEESNCSETCTSQSNLSRLASDFETYTKDELKIMEKVLIILDFAFPNASYFETSYPPSSSYPPYKKCYVD